jgi:small subunit ribosomal protein S17
MAEIQRPLARTREGIVLKDKMDKTRIVAVSRLFREQRYQKVVQKRVKYAVHDEKNESHVGDRVRIIESRPLSRSKRWRIIQVVEKVKA